MLVELTVRNFAVIEETRLALGDGLCVITGETGAGKSLLVDAIELVLGGPADRSLVRVGAEGASVEAVFELRNLGPALGGVLEEAGVELDENGTLALFREVHRGGRTVSRVNGRVVPVGTVRQVGAALVDIHGQSTHLSLLDPVHQRAMLDAYAETEAERDAVAEAVSEIRRLEGELAELAEGARLAEQQQDLLRFQVEEIGSVGPVPGEETALAQEREVLANARAIHEACSAAYEALYGGDSNAGDLIGEAVQALRRSVDPAGAIRRQIDALEASAAELGEAAREIRAYADTVEANPARLDEIEERIEGVRRLKRRYGDDEEAVLAFAADAQRQLDASEHSDDHRKEIQAAVAEARQRAGEVAWVLSEARHSAAQGLADAAALELGAVGMDQVRFAATVTRSEAEGGLTVRDGGTYAFDATGIDAVEFEVETNPGEGMKPLARVASGGETSRLMLALIGALRASGGVPTLVFDEMDAGIGARVSEVVGQKLWTQGRSAQVLCVTHLPQIAAYADRHFRVEKSVADDRTFAGARALDGSARLGELAEMLGGRRSTELDGAAQQMLEAAERVKQTVRG